MRAAVATAALATASTLVGYYLLRRRAAGTAGEARERPREGAGRSEGDEGDEEEEDDDEEGEVCAICLSKPELPCRTQCGHRFCLGCFRSWASRQVPPTSTLTNGDALYAVFMRSKATYSPVLSLRRFFLRSMILIAPPGVSMPMSPAPFLKRAGNIVPVGHTSRETGSGESE